MVLAGLATGLLVLVAVVAGEWRFARVERGLGWRARVVRALVVGLPVVVLSPGWWWYAQRRLLPVAAPAPARGGALELSALLVGLVVVGWAVVRVLPALVGAWRPRRLPSGRFVLGAGIVAALAVGAAGVGRWALGVPGGRFSVYGAVTPDGARGLRVERAVGALTGGELERPLARGVSHDSPYDGSALRPGLHGWIDGRPVLIDVAGGQPTLHAIAADVLAREGRPRFAVEPRWAPATRERLLVVERRGGGEVQAVLLDRSGSVWPAALEDAGLMVVPPLWPFALLLVGGAAGGLLQRRRRGGEGAALARCLTGWLLLEGAVAALLGMLPFLSM